jgi:hypothetical protein
VEDTDVVVSQIIVDIVEESLLEFFNINEVPVGEFCLEPQSGNASVEVMKMADIVEQNVKFNDTSVNHVVDASGELDATRMAQDSNDASLENFFRRPIKIGTVNWTTASGLPVASIDPWGLYFNNPRVSNRITNFNLLRCKLHLKFVINGNAFLYGRSAAIYHPLAGVDALTNTSPIVQENLTQLLQMPKVFINPTNSVAGEMILPFFWPKNYLNIPTSDWDAMGRLYIREINPLKHANGATENVSISIFAWAEDVSMSVLTSVDTDTIIPQSGEIEEANKEGMISGPATRIAAAADIVSQIPLIKPYAIATSKVASMTSQMAKLLGYARPNVTADPAPLRPTMVSSLATTTTPDGAVKITVDDKQELSVDPTIAGVNCSDPLDVLGIAQRESYLTTFDWTVADGPETHLWNVRVDPCTWAENSNAFYFPSTAVAALPFRYWTGTINYRFQIVSSGFHRGRLRFVYDPNFGATSEYNTNYLEIVDINEKSDFTISISNGQDVTWLDHIEPGFDSIATSYNVLPFGSKGPGNGVLSVRVVNELTTPNSTVNNDIQVNVYISAGDDFQCAVPYDQIGRFVLKPQSGVLEPQSGTLKEGEGPNTDETDAPMQEESDRVGIAPDPLTNIASVFMGETIKSFRPLLKRYVLHEAFGPEAASARTMFGTRCIYPYCRGNVLDAVHEAVGPVPYNFCNTTLFHWISTAHSGHRGSMRYKIIPRGNRSSSDTMVGMIERADFPASGDNYLQNNAAQFVYTNNNEAAAAAVLGAGTTGETRVKSLVGYNGLHRITSDINPACEFEVPFYSNYRFVPGKHQNYTGATNFLGIRMAGWKYQYFLDGDSDSLLEVHVACGEDWTPYFYTGLPPMYFENAPPDPA